MDQREAPVNFITISVKSFDPWLNFVLYWQIHVVNQLANHFNCLNISLCFHKLLFELCFQTFTTQHGLQYHSYYLRGNNLICS